MTWKVPRIWQGGDCWIIGGGASVHEQFQIPEELVTKVRTKQAPISTLSPYFAPIHKKHVIGVNTAFMLGNWIDILFFGDGKFFDKFRPEILAFPGIRVSCHKRIKDTPKIKHIARGRKGQGIETKRGFVSWNGNSGAAAISLANHLGVKKIYLLGFDMDLTEGYQHWHNQYTPEGSNLKKEPGSKLPFSRHLRGFPAIAQDAKEMGLEIINVNPKSKITVFPRKSLKEVLDE